MNEEFFTELSAWLTEAGLAGTPETAIVSGFCDRCVAAGLPLARSLLFIDTLHPVHEGRLFRWGYSPAETPLLEYGRTSPDALAASGFNPRDVEIAERCLLRGDRIRHVFAAGAGHCTQFPFFW